MNSRDIPGAADAVPFPETLPPLRVLAVDDSAPSLALLEICLKRLGHAVVCVGSGAEAVRRYPDVAPDLVLMDVMMPGMSGYEATTELKRLAGSKWVPVVFLSALSQDADLVRGLEAGGDDYLTKPINMPILKAKVQSIQRAVYTQRALAASEQRWQFALEGAGDGVWDWNVQTGDVFYSHRWKEMLGYAGDEVAPRIEEWQRLSHADDLAVCQERLHQHFDGLTDVYICEHRMLARDGSWKWILDRGRVIERDASGAVLRMIGTHTDITERKRAESLLRENEHRLRQYHDATQAEQHMAAELLAKMTRREGLADPLLRWAVEPAQTFSGDLVAAARSRDGRLYVLLADATGHGLSAAIAMVPVLNIFYAATADAAPVAAVATEINRQLKHTMPVDRYVAALLVSVDERTRSVDVWNGGMPEGLFVDRTGAIVHAFAPRHLPLGILPPALFDASVVSFAWNVPGQLLFHSDGLVEATSREGTQFGRERLDAVLGATPAGQRFDAVLGALARHLDGERAHDDVSLAVVDCR